MTKKGLLCGALLALSGGNIQAALVDLEGVTFEEAVQPFFKEYCYDCHDSVSSKAEVNLEAYGPDVVMARDMKFWERVQHMLTAREMPPEKKPQPSEEERLLVTAFIEKQLATFDCDTVDPGRVTIRRLNRAEYNNTIRDLAGVDFKPADDFPIDEVGYGFDNIGDLLSLPPLLMEKYLDAAGAIASKAIMTDWPPPPDSRRVEGETFSSQEEEDSIRAEGQVLGLYRTGEATNSVRLDEAGEYLIKTRSYGEQAGPEPPRLSVEIAGQKKVFEVKETRSKPRNFEFRVTLSAGEHSVSLGYLNNYVVQDHPDPELRGDRNLFVDYVEIVGPVDKPAPDLPRSHRLIIFKDPQEGQEMEAARDIMRRFASRAYRRPVSDREIEDLMGLVDMVMKDEGSFEEAIQVAVQAVLISPHFLFRWELDPKALPGGEVRQLGDYELASRMSYFIWSSMPDEELIDLAGQGKLQDQKVRDAQVERMLQDPKAMALVENFAGQWLQFRNLDGLRPDPELFPEFGDELKAGMKKETALFFASIMKEDRSVLELLDSDYTFLNEQLAAHYGIPGVEGEEFRKVSLPADSPRGGVLTHGSVLTLTSNPTRTSPVMRGKWVLEQILGTPPPPPPPDVGELPESEEAISSGSLRQRLELHRAKPECATCHSKMDPIGFALENFDAVGKWRAMDGEFPIDPSGVLPGGESFNGPEGLKEILKTRETFVRTLVEKMLTFALGRGLEYYDKCAVDDIFAGLVANEYRFSELIKGAVNTEPFLLRKKEGDS